MAKYRPHIVFIFLMLVYFFVRYLRISTSELPNFIRFYFTDLLFIPAMACFGLVFVRILKQDYTIVLPTALILFQTLFISIFFEGYLPTYGMNDHIYTHDLMDVFMYLLGAIIYLLLQRLFFSTSSPPPESKC